MSTTSSNDGIRSNKARLNAAFRDLRRQGFLGKQDYTCCQSCGIPELHEETLALAEQGRRVQGGVFYHAQDTEHLRKTGCCHLTFVALDFGDGLSEDALLAQALQTAQAILEALRRRGVKAEWDGSGGRRIAINLNESGPK